MTSPIAKISLVTLFAIFAMQIARADTVYTYASHGLDLARWQSPVRIQVAEETTKSGAYVGMQSDFENATFCSSAEPFQCFSSNILNFSVPKQLIKVGDAWNHNGYSYVVKKTYDAKFIGESIPVQQIQAYSNNVLIASFLYSCSRGLIGITIHGESDFSQSRQYLLEQKFGFGVGKSCRKISAD